MVCIIENKFQEIDSVAIVSLQVVIKIILTMKNIKTIKI